MTNTKSYTYYTIKTNGAGWASAQTEYAATAEEADRIYKDAECADTPVKRTIRNPKRIAEIKELIKND